MTDMLTRPLTTENRLLRAVGGMDLSVSLGTSLGAQFQAPTLGNLVSDFAERLSARQVETPDEITSRMQAEFLDQQKFRDLSVALRNSASTQEADSIRSEITALSDNASVRADTATQKMIDDGRVQTPEALNEQYGDIGLTFDRPTSTEEARILADGKRAEIIRNALIEAGPQGAGATVLRFVAGLAAMAVDPLEVATMFIPVVGQAGKAAAVARFGRVGGRVVVGAVEGGVGNALTEPFYYGLSRSAQLDYDMSDALLNIGLGVVFGGGIGAVAGAFSRADIRDAPKGKTEVIDNVAIFDEAYRRSMSQQRASADVALRQFVNSQGVDVAMVAPRSGVSDAVADLSRELRSASKYPLTSAIKKNVGIHPDGVLGKELAANGITPRTAPGLFTRRGGRDLDTLVASEWEEIVPGISARAGVANGYLDTNGLISAIVDELAGRGAGVDVRAKSDVIRDIAALEADNNRIEKARAAAAAEGVTLRTDAEARFIADRMGDDLESALERLAFMDEGDVAVQIERNSFADPMTDFRASEAASVRVGDDFLDRDLADFDAMVKQMPMTDELAFEIAAIEAIETRARAYADVAEAAATCLARTA